MDGEGVVNPYKFSQETLDLLSSYKVKYKQLNPGFPDWLVNTIVEYMHFTDSIPEELKV